MPRTPSSRTQSRSSSSPFGFDRSYKPKGGVPTVSLTPSSSSAYFTSHAYSSDGAFLALGQSDGAISVWKASEYNEKATYPARESTSAISALVFADGEKKLVFATADGHTGKCDVNAYKDFTDYRPDDNSDARSSDQSRPAVRKTHHLSDNGLILACYKWDQTPIRRLEKIKIRHLAENLNPILIDITEEQFSVPFISRNGKSLFWCSYTMTADAGNGQKIQKFQKATVIPQLDFNRGNEQVKIELEAERATWGLDGTYLLVWSSLNKTPVLSVYRTADLQSSESKPIGELKLGIGNSKLMAQMLETGEESKTEVLISDLNQSGGTRFILWDVVTDKIKWEDRAPVRSHMLPNMQNRPLVLQQRTGLAAEETGTAKSRYENLYKMAIAEAFPSFALSNDQYWIGFFSWKADSCTVSSVRSGVTVWRYDLPRTNQWRFSQRPVEVFFDKSQQSFVLIKEDVVLVSTPSFLSRRTDNRIAEDSTSNYTTIPSSEEHWPTSYLSLPGKAFATVGRKVKADQNSEPSFFPGLNEEPSTIEKRRSEIVDAAISQDGSMWVYLLNPKNEPQMMIRVVTQTPNGAANTEEIECPDSVTAPTKNLEEKFKRPRLFLYGQDHRRLALFLTGAAKIIAFWKIDGKESKGIKTLNDIHYCLRVSQTEDYTKLVILDVEHVRIFDLERQCFDKMIQYQSNFRLLFDHLRNAVEPKWNFPVNKKNGQCVISDSGREVLLGWDVEKKKSIVITPSMSHSQSIELVNEGQGSLSTACTLAKNGKSTSFLDMKELLVDGKLVIGTFHQSTESIVNRVVAMEFASVDENDIERLVLNFFYGISKDGKRLISLMAPFKGSANQQYTVSENGTELKKAAESASGGESSADGRGIRSFTIHECVDGIPLYNHLSLQPPYAFEDSIKKLILDQGFFIINAPSFKGTSFVQEAIMAGEKRIINILVSQVDKYKSTFGLVWINPETGAPNDLLEWAMQKKSRNKVKYILHEFISKKFTPFRSVSAIMKDSFRKLLVNYRSVLDEALSRNLLAREVCKLHVHVEFTNAEIMRDRGVHIGMSDVVCEWLQIEGNEYLKANWERIKEKEIKEMDEKYEDSYERVALKCVAIENAAMPGYEGIIRPLLMEPDPLHFFAFDVVVWTVTVKWFKIWKRRHFWKVIEYLIFIAYFIFYQLILKSVLSMGSFSAWKEVVGRLVIIVPFPYFIVSGILTFCRYCSRLMRNRSGQQRIVSLALIKNMLFKQSSVHLTSSLLLILICMFHCLCILKGDQFYNHCLYICLAIQSLFVTCNVWYYLLPYRGFGSLIMIVRRVAHGCWNFTLLAAILMFGFALSSLSISGSVRSLDKHRNFTSNSIDETTTEALKCLTYSRESYGNIFRSMLTSFYSLFGAFDKQEYLCNSDWIAWLSTLLFVSFLIIMAFFMLNLLISVIGHKYTTLQAKKEALLTQARAEYIDAAEMEMSLEEEKRIKAETEKYVYALTPVDNDDERQYGEEYTETGVGVDMRSASNSKEERLITELREVLGRMANLDERISVMESRMLRSSG